VISADDRHTVLFVTEGEGEVEIGARRFAGILLFTLEEM
jgi:hypothetical protein